MSSKARRRHEKGLEMAEAVIERTREKLEKSMGRERNVKDRRKAWEDINKAAVTVENGGEEKMVEDKEAGWETDEEMGAAPVDALTAPVVASVPEPAQVPLPPVDDDDEIL